MENLELEKFIKDEPDFKWFKKRNHKNKIFYIDHFINEQNIEGSNPHYSFVYYNEEERDNDFTFLA
jgi:hypothetical protein